MKKKNTINLLPLFSLALLSLYSCEVLDDDIEKHTSPQEDSTVVIGLDEVAALFSALPLHTSNIREVHDAVSSSSGNGYDEEYTMRLIFENPGAGVGEQETKAGKSYDVPLRELIEKQVRSMAETKSASGGHKMDADTYLAALTGSDIQVYWPFSEKWDGSSMPVITFDPEDGSETNIGYETVTDEDGVRRVQKVLVDEEMAKERPVWVVNRNSDAGYTTLELLRRADPDWGEGGGAIIVNPITLENRTRSENDNLRTLILKDFTMKRNYDPWFAGASEFFVKTGAVDDFTASTEAELKLYNPQVTDFMIVVRRSQVGEPVPFNAILVSEWTGQMTHCAFMVSEDDGGTRTSWTAKALVKVASKSYGVEITLPLNTRDDIVWRGQLARSWIEEHNGEAGHFGDIDLTFEITD